MGFCSNAESNKEKSLKVCRFSIFTVNDGEDLDNFVYIRDFWKLQVHLQSNKTNMSHVLFLYMTRQLTHAHVAFLRSKSNHIDVYI